MTSRILLVEDNDDLRAVLRTGLERAGYVVHAAVDGRAALRVLGQEPVDLVITDILMPDMDGLELIRSLRLSHPALPVIAISGGARLAMGDFLPVAKAFGAVQTLTKPFAISQLIEAVRALIG